MKNAPSSQQLLTAGELAARLGVAVSTVRRWAREHRIPSLRLSRKVVRYDIRAVENAALRSPEGGQRDV